ncbi:hypothetical protein TruAng_004219 [Truncatella angustata]|nr:hypothetical protein TruAng_004219 [Truncatella angustata]
MKSHVGYIPPYIRDRKAALGGDALDTIWGEVQIGNINATVPDTFKPPTAGFENNPDYTINFRPAGFERRDSLGNLSSQGTLGCIFKVYSKERLPQNLRQQLEHIGARLGPAYEPLREQQASFAVEQRGADDSPASSIEADDMGSSDEDQAKPVGDMDLGEGNSVALKKGNGRL